MKANKLLKAISTIALAATMTFTTLAVPTAAAWQTTDSGKQWVEADGTVAKSKWLTMKTGNRYYINSKGIMATGLFTLTETKNGKSTKSIYYFDKSGVMQTGWQYINKKYYYFDIKSGKAYTGTKTIGDYKFKFDSKGVWNEKVYNKSGKDVTAKTDIEALTGIKPKTSTKTTSTTKSETVMIAGQEYKTDITKLLINKDGVTDEDLENLKYLTKLKRLDIVPGATHLCGDEYYDYSDVIMTGTSIGGWKKDITLYNYEFTATARKANNTITNLDFCAYMPKLEVLTVAFASKLNDITGLSNLTRLQSVMFYNCTALTDVKALKTENFQKGDASLGVCFTDDVKYAFNDLHFGSRIKVFSASVLVEPRTERYKWSISEKLKLDGTEDYSYYLFVTTYAKSSTTPRFKYLRYNCGKLERNDFGI